MENESGPASDPGLDDVLAWNVVRVARFIGNRMTRRLAGHGLNPIHFGVLAFLAETPEMTTAEVARAVLIRPQSMAPLLDGLEGRGLVRRTGARERGRRNPVEITDEGRRALGGVWRIALDANDLTDAGLTADESEQLNALLLKIVPAAESAPPDGDGVGDDPPWSGSSAGSSAGAGSGTQAPRARS